MGLVSLAESVIYFDVGVKLVPAMSAYHSEKPTDVLDEFDLAPRRQRCRLNAIPHSGHQLVQSFQTWAANLPVGLGVRRDDIGHLWRVEECAMNSFVWHNLLAKDRHIVVRADQCIQGVHSFPWISTCVCTPAGKLTVDFLSSVHEDACDAVGRLGRVKALRTGVTFHVSSSSLKVRKHTPSMKYPHPCTRPHLSTWLFHRRSPRPAYRAAVSARGRPASSTRMTKPGRRQHLR